MPTDKPALISRADALQKRLSWITQHASGARELNLLDYWRIILARRWTVFSVTALVVIGTLFWTLAQTPIYRASAKIQIDRENQNILSFKDVYEVEVGTDDTLRTQFEILKSVALANSVIDDLHLEKTAEFQPDPPSPLRIWLNGLMPRFSKVAPSPAEVESSGSREKTGGLPDQYLARVDVSPVRQSRLVTLSFDGKDADLAAKIVNAHADHFIEQNLRFKFEATQQASDFLTLQLKNLKSTLEQAEDNLQTYSRDHELLFTEEGKNTATEKLKQLEQEYTTAQADRIRKETFVRLVEGGSAESLPQLLNYPLLGNLVAKLADLRREDSQLSVTFGPDYPERQRIRLQVQQIEASIKTEKTQATQNVKTDYAAAVQHEELLSQALEEQRGIVNKTNQEIIQYNILKREVDSNKQLYDGLLTRLKEAGVSAGLRASNIRVVDRARIPRTAIFPQKTWNLIRALAVGLGLGLIGAFIREYVDDSIKSTEDITQHFGLPVLGFIPKLGTSERKRYGYGYKALTEQKADPAKFRIETAAHTAPGSVIAEAYRSLRTSLLLSTADHPPKSVLVTSATPSEGKTATSSNCAISLTQTGARVVLIDGDMRRPRMHEIFGVDNSVGLSNFLTGTASLKDVLQQSSIPNLYVIPSGVVPPNPVELILSDRFSQLMNALTKYFDHIVVDSPPVANVADPRVLAQSCDGILLVVKGMATSRHRVRKALEHLSESRTPLIGVILNDINAKQRSSYYPYYYPSDYYSDYKQQSAAGS